MNVILIISDSLRRDHLSCYRSHVCPPDKRYGQPYHIHTPHLDFFSSQACIFDNAYIGSFPTVPCRNDILTGRYTFTYKPWAPLADTEVTLTDVLNQAGYVTALFADTPHPYQAGFNYQRGFQAWEIIRGQEGDRWKSAPREVALPCDPSKLRHGARVTSQYLRNVSGRRLEEDYFPARTAKAASAWLEENHSSPFFLCVDTFDPHEPWDPPQHYLRRYISEYTGQAVIYPRYDAASIYTDEEIRYCRAAYAGEISLVDRWIGYLLQRVDDLDIADETMIIVMSDHGFYFGEHDHIGKSLITQQYMHSLALYPEIAHMPFIVRVPGCQTPRTDTLAQPVDVMPTILDFLGLETPNSVQGVSLLPALRGDREQTRPICVASPTISGSDVLTPHPSDRSTIVNGEWMLIFGNQTDLANRELRTMTVASFKRGVESVDIGPIMPELYHLPSDPGCEHNCITENIAVAERLHAEFIRFLTDSGAQPQHIEQFMRFSVAG